MVLLLVVIYIAFISLGLPDSLFGVAWPVMHIEFGLELFFASWMTIIVAGGTIMTSFFTGKLIRKFSTWTVTSVSITLTAIALIGISFAKSIWLIVFFAILLGVGAGAVDGGLNDYVAKHFKPFQMSWLHSFWGVGVTLTPILMSYFLADGNWRKGYLAISIIQFVIALLVFLSQPLWRKVQVTDNSTSTQQQSAEQPSEVAKHKSINPIRIKGVILSLIAFAFYCGMENIIGTWGASFLINTKGVTPSTASLWISLYFGGIMLGRFINGFLTFKYSDKTLIRLGLSIAAVGAILLMLPLPSVVALCGLLLTGMGFAPIFPSCIHATQTRFDPTYSPDIIGFQMGFAYIGILVFQPVFGLIASKTTFSLMPYVVFAFTCIVLLATEILNAKVKANGAPLSYEQQ